MTLRRIIVALFTPWARIHCRHGRGLLSSMTTTHHHAH